MLKVTTIVAAAAIAATAFTGNAQAENGQIAAGVAGGLAVGALVGAAAASSNRDYYAGPGYARPYYTPTYGRCYITREYDGFRYRRVRVCD